MVEGKEVFEHFMLFLLINSYPFSLKILSLSSPAATAFVTVLLEFDFYAFQCSICLCSGNILAKLAAAWVASWYPSIALILLLFYYKLTISLKAMVASFWLPAPPPLTLTQIYFLLFLFSDYSFDCSCCLYHHQCYNFFKKRRRRKEEKENFIFIANLAVWNWKMSALDLVFFFVA